MCKKLILALIVTILITVTTTPTLAHPPECGALASVQRSADPQYNESSGGHLTNHIKDLVPNGRARFGNTFFEDTSDWSRAYTDLIQKRRPHCKVPGSPGDQVGQTFDLQLTSYKCNGVDAQGCCDDYRQIQTSRVTVVLKVNHNREWIILTAYPHN